MFSEALKIQGRVILALMLREARTRYGRTQAGYLWALIEPMIHTGLFLLLFNLRGRVVMIGDSVPMFLATGVATYFGFRNVVMRTKGGYGSNEALLAFPIVKVFDVFFARALLELGTWMCVSILLIGGLILTGYGAPPRSILEMAAAVLALFSIGFGLGTAIGIGAEFIPMLSSVINVPMRILYFASGLFYLPDNMSPFIRDIIWWNPVLHGITLFRVGYYRMYDSHILNTTYLFSWAVGCMLLALLVERLTRKSIRNLP